MGPCVCVGLRSGSGTCAFTTSGQKAHACHKPYVLVALVAFFGVLAAAAEEALQRA